MSEEKKPRIRGPKFGDMERDLLLDLAIKNKSIVESKLTNKVTKKMKDKVWEETQNAVNSLGYANRTAKEYKIKWSNMLQRAKFQKSEQEAHMRQTGGGPPPKPLSPCTERVLLHFGSGTSFNGLTGVQSSFDDDEGDMVSFLAQDSSSPRSCNIINDIMTASGDAPAVITSGETSSQVSSRAPPTSVAQSGSRFSTTISLRTSSTSPAQSGSENSTYVPVRAPSTVVTQSCTSTSNTVLFRKSNEIKKRKITHDDVTEAQYEVLQLQKEKIKQQIRFYKLQNDKLERELQMN